MSSVIRGLIENLGDLIMVKIKGIKGRSSLSSTKYWRLN